MISHRKNYINSILAVIILLGIDKISKWWAVSALKTDQDIVLVKGILEFSYLENYGAAFNSFMGMRTLLITANLIVIGVIIWKYFCIPWEKKYAWMRICFLLLISGAVGNVTDRIFRGYVVDFIYFVPIDFPKFNIADSYVVVSIIVLAFLLFTCYDAKDVDNLFSIKKKWTTEED